VKNGKFYIKSTKRGHKMIEIGNFDLKMAVKEEYLAGRMSIEEYSNYLNAIQKHPKTTISAKKALIDPNLAFRKRKGKETSFKKNPFNEIAERLLAKPKKMVPVGEGKYAWMDHAQEPDDDVPF
jgi:hypothetical protein